MEALKQLEGNSAVNGRLFVIAPNFSVDCLETLYDIEIELREAYRAQALAAGANKNATAVDLHYIPCLNDSDAHVHLLSALISEYRSRFPPS